MSVVRSTLPAVDLAMISLLAAVVAVFGLLPAVNVGFAAVPITAQSMGPMLAGLVLGARRGALAMALLLLLVAVGLPLLSGGRGGLAPFSGPSAGFLLGYVAAAFVIGLLAPVHRRRMPFWQLVAASLVGGIGMLYLIGIPIMALVSGMSLGKAIGAAAVFLPGDGIKVLLAAAVAGRIRPLGLVDSRQPMTDNR